MLRYSEASASILCMRRSFAALRMTLLVASCCAGCVHVEESRIGGPAAEAAGLAIMPWEIQPDKQRMMDDPLHGLGSLRECGFNTVAFVRPDQVDDCAKLGMRVIINRPTPQRTNWREMSDQAID